MARYGDAEALLGSDEVVGILGGVGDVDNLVGSEDEMFAGLPQDANGYIDRNAVFDAIREELAGRPLQSMDEEALQAATDDLIDAVETAKARFWA